MSIACARTHVSLSAELTMQSEAALVPGETTWAVTYCCIASPFGAWLWKYALPLASVRTVKDTPFVARSVLPPPRVPPGQVDAERTRIEYSLFASPVSRPAIRAGPDV